MSDEKLEVYFNYGLVLRLPYEKIDTLNKLLEENGIRIIYQKPSLGRIYIQSPSGSKTEGAEIENKWKRGCYFERIH